MLIIPVSSSRLMKMTPEAVAGRCRWVTMPGHQHPGAVLDRRAARRRAHPERVQPVTDELGRIGLRRDAGGPDVGDGQLHVAHPRQRRRVQADAWCRAGCPARSPAAAPAAHNARRRSGRRPSARRRWSGVQRAGGGQRLGLRRGQGDRSGQLVEVGVPRRPAGRRRSARPARRRWCAPGQAEPDRRPAVRSRLRGRRAALEVFTSGRRTVTPCRRASATSDCGE